MLPFVDMSLKSYLICRLTRHLSLSVLAIDVVKKPSCVYFRVSCCLEFAGCIFRGVTEHVPSSLVSTRSRSRGLISIRRDNLARIRQR